MGGGGRAYNACTPVVDGPIILCSGVGRGTKAFKIEKQGDTAAAKEVWSNSENAVQFNTPVLKNGALFGFSSGNDFFCISEQDGKTYPVAWINQYGKARVFGTTFGHSDETFRDPIFLTYASRGILWASGRLDN